MFKIVSFWLETLWSSTAFRGIWRISVIEDNVLFVERALESHRRLVWQRVSPPGGEPLKLTACPRISLRVQIICLSCVALERLCVGLVSLDRPTSRGARRLIY